MMHGVAAALVVDAPEVAHFLVTARRCSFSSFGGLDIWWVWAGDEGSVDDVVVRSDLWNWRRGCEGGRKRRGRWRTEDRGGG